MGKDLELLQAVRNQDLHALQKLLGKTKLPKSKLIGTGKKANVNFQDQDGMCALHQAALVGATDIMRLLLENNAQVDIKDQKGMRALHYAAWQGNIDPVGILLRAGSSANEPSYDGMTPLHLACEHGHYEVVSLLLNHQGDPTRINHIYKTPLHLACEFGRYRVVELLILSTRCTSLLVNSPDDMADSNRTTCIHLAAKNGHTDILRLLLQAGVDINRQTLQGTCLHEAALYGKIEVVKLLLDCGIDVNQLNSSDQSALDIVNKFTTSRAGRELKQLLKEASYAVHARAIKEYYNMHEPNHVSFREGDYIRVVEKHPSGMWKGYVISSDGPASKTGYFPANHVVLVDAQALANRPLSGYSSGSGGERSPCPVMSPQVPDLIAKQHQCHSNGQTVIENEYTHMTVGCDESFPPPPSPLVSPKNHYNHTDTDRDSGISPQQSYPSQPFPSPQGFPRQNSPHSPAERTAEWIGRYVSVAGSDGHSGSPASSSRGSPSSSNRNSISSTNSGGYVSGHYVNSYQPHGPTPHPQNTPHQGGGSGSANPTHPHPHQQHRLSGQSYESGVSGVNSRHSYHSGSSSSLGSLDRLEESGYASTINVHELFHQGLQDHEVLRAWLTDLHFEEYYTMFIHAGYDMPTISRMTPEDLTAIGITKPAHRKRLKAEISKLHIHDGIPDFKPHDVVQWLQLLMLDDYIHTLTSQGYTDIDSLTDITWEDLEEIGIKRLGHQKKIMLAIDRLRRIQNGQFRLSANEHKSSQEMLEPPSSFPTPQWLEHPNHHPQGKMNSHPQHPNGGQIYCETVPVTTNHHAPRSPSLDNIASRSSGVDPRSNYRSHEEIYSKPSTQQQMSFPAHQVALQSEYAIPRNNKPTTGAYQPDVVAIQVSQPSNRHNSLVSESETEVMTTSSSRTHYSFQSPIATRSRHSSGDATPTYDRGGLSGDETDGSSGTLKRPSARISPLPKPKPIAKVLAKTRRSSHEFSPEDISKFQDYQNSQQMMMDGYSHNEAPGYMNNKQSLMPHHMDTLRKNKSSEHIYDCPAEQSPKHLLHSPVIGTGKGSAPNSPYKKNANFFGGNGSGSSGSINGGSTTSSNQGVKPKKAPPPPPKRTNSIKQTTSPMLLQQQQQAVSASQSNAVNSSSSVQSALSVSIPPDNPKSTGSPRHTSPQSGQGSPSSHYSPKPMPLLNTSSYSSCMKSLSEKFRPGSGSTGSISSSNGGGSRERVSGPPPPVCVKPKINMNNQTSSSSSSSNTSADIYRGTGPSSSNHRDSHVTHHKQPPNSGHRTNNSRTSFNEVGNPLNDVIHQLELQASSLNTVNKDETDVAAMATSKCSKDTRLGDWQDNHSDSSSDSDTGTVKRRPGGGISSESSSSSSGSQDNMDINNKRQNYQETVNGGDSGSCNVTKQDGELSSNELQRTNSTGTIDSNTLPFANENVGTIKQRNAVAKPSIVSVSSVDGAEGGCGEKNVELNTSVFSSSSEDETGTMKRKSKYNGGNTNGNNTSSQHPTASNQEVKKVAPPTPQRQTSLVKQNNGANGPQSGDVLNDIGNMLQDLTDELDAMLEFEIPE